MDQLYETLGQTQSHEQNIRQNAESRLQSLVAQSDGGLNLCRIVFSQEAAQPIRQLSALMLKKYVTQYWSANFPQFIGPVTSPEIKAQIREMLLQGLTEPESKIRSAVAFALSSIANSDWPNDFPQLLPALFNIINPDNTTKDQNAIHGAMRVLAEFVRSDIMEEQLLDLLRESMPVLLAVLRDPETKFTTRSQCVKIFRTSSKTLYMMKDQYPAVVNQAMEGVMPSWITAIGEVLEKDINIDQDPHWEGIDMRNEIFRTLTVLQASFPRVLQPTLSSFIRLSLSHLDRLAPQFEEFYLSTGQSALEPPETPNADEGNNAGITDLGASIYDFLTGACRSRAARAVMVSRNAEGGQLGAGSGMRREQPTPTLESLVMQIVGWARITREDAEVWVDDPNAFVADEDDEAEAYSLRTAGFDLLGSLLDKFESTVARVLQLATRKWMERSDQLRQQGDPDWWKPLEAALACTGSVADALLNMVDDESNEGVAKSFDLTHLFTQVVPQLLTMNDSPFLQGRAFVFASQFVLTLAESGISGQYLGAAVDALENDAAESVVKISAIKTIRNFCRYIKPDELRPLSLRIVSDLGPYLTQATEETLALVLETIRAVIGVDGSVLNRDSTAQLVKVILDVWAANATDPVLTAIVEEVLETLAGSPSDEVYDSLVATTCPVLSNILMADPTPETMTLSATAVELLTAILKGRKGSLGQEVGPLSWPALFHCMLTCEDCDTTQYGSVALTTFVRKGGEQMLSWVDNSGRSGLQLTLAVLARLIDPSFSESGGLSVGDLILHLLRNAGPQLTTVIPDLLSAIARRIATAKSALFIQSLCLPFAYLLTVEMDLTLQLLENMSIPPSQDNSPAQSGLQIVIGSWCDGAIDTVQGSYSIKVNDMAMANLLASERPSLKNVVVKGDMIVDETNRNTIMTRSRTKNNPNTFEMIPFHQRAMKYLLGQLQNAEIAEAEDAKLSLDDDVPQDDGDEEWEEEDDLSNNEKQEMAWLSDMLGGGGKWDGFEDDMGGQDDDEDLMNDQLMQLNMPTHIVEVMRHAYVKNVNSVQDLAGGLNSMEKLVLSKRVLSM